MPDRRVVVYHQNSNQAVLPFWNEAQSSLRFHLTMGRSATRSRQAIRFVRLMSLAVTLSLMFLHHGSRGDFLRPVPVAPGALRTLFDMLVLSLFFCAHATKVLFFRHQFLFSNNYSISSPLSP